MLATSIKTHIQLIAIGPRLTELHFDRMGFRSTFSKSISVWIDQR